MTGLSEICCIRHLQISVIAAIIPEVSADTFASPVLVRRSPPSGEGGCGEAGSHAAKRNVIRVRGSFSKFGERRTRGESPSPASHLRCDATSPRERGEVKRESSLRPERRRNDCQRGRFKNGRAACR